jgi:hypothetical protein
LPPRAADDTSVARVEYALPVNFDLPGTSPAYLAMRGKSSTIRFKAGLLAMLLAAICACGMESWKRTGYETFQNIQRRQCEKTLSDSRECGERKAYETYRREVENAGTDQAPDLN